LVGFPKKKTPLTCHSERSEESCVPIGRIIIIALLPNRINHFRSLPPGILPRPKARSEWQMKE